MARILVINPNRSITRDGADVPGLGCAGMARCRERVERALGVSVIDPTQAAVAQAPAALALGWRRAPPVKEP